MKNILKIFSASYLIIMLSSCSSALLTSSWTKQGYTAKTYKKVMVLAIGKNTSGRAVVEGAMVKELKKEGVNAVSTLDVFPNFTPDVKLEKSAIAQALKEKSVDGLLVLSVLDVKTEQVYVQGQTYTQPVTTTNPVYHPNGYYNQYYPYYNNYYNYYSTVYETVHEEGYYEDQTTYYLESNFYSVDDETLTWSAQCEAVDPANIGSGAKDWAAEVVGGMMYDKIFVAPAK